MSFNIVELQEEIELECQFLSQRDLQCYAKECSVEDMEFEKMSRTELVDFIVKTEIQNFVK